MKFSEETLAFLLSQMLMPVAKLVGDKLETIADSPIMRVLFQFATEVFNHALDKEEAKIPPFEGK